MYNKTKIFNLALNALLLNKQISNADTDQTAEAANLRMLWDTAVESFLEECDLNETSTTVLLTLVAQNPNDKWLYAYKYPDKCAFLRRIDSGYLKDNEDTLVLKQVGVLDGEKVILTNKQNAYAEIVTSDDFMVGLSANAAQALAHKLAWFSTPLIANSTDPSALANRIQKNYELFKSLAEKKDAKENYLPDQPEDESDTSRARLS